MPEQQSHHPPTREELAIEGVVWWRIPTHGDRRGAFTEMFRQEWQVGVDLLQWNVVTSAANVLRGVHVHVRHSDYLVVVAGRMRLGLHDVRRDSTSAGKSVSLELDQISPCAIAIPPGVLHGFYFPVDSVHVYSVSEYWKPEEEMGCHFADPSLGIDWGFETEPIVSERDRTLPPLAELVSRFESWQDGRREATR